MTKNILNREAKRLIENGAKVIDIRDAKDFGDSHIPGAFNIGIDDLKKLHFDKYDTIIVVCYSGIRSIAAAEILTELGYKNVFNLKNGYDNYWNQKKFQEIKRFF